MATKMIKGKPTTRDQAVVENMKLVYREALKWLHRAKRVGLEREDLESVGAIGLMKAFDDFDESKGFSFSTYAVPKILGEISRAVMNGADGDIRYSVGVKSNAIKIDKQQLAKEPVEVIAEKLGITQSSVQTALEYLSKKEPLRLDATIENSGKSEENGLFHDLVGNSLDLSHIVIDDFKQYLTEKERDVLDLALAGYGNAQIGKALGFSRSYGGLYMPGIKKKLEDYLADKKLRRVSGMEKVEVMPGGLTIENYLALSAQGDLKEYEIASKLGVDKRKLSNWKYLNKEKIEAALGGSISKRAALASVSPRRSLREEKPALIEELTTKLEEAKETIKEQQQKLAGYDQLETDYQDLVKKAGEREAAYKQEIRKLQEQVTRFSGINAACDDVESELEELKDKNSLLLQENTYLKGLVKLWMP